MKVPREFIGCLLIFAAVVRDVKLSDSVTVDRGLVSADDKSLQPLGHAKRKMQGSLDSVRAVGIPYGTDRPLVSQRR